MKKRILLLTAIIVVTAFMTIGYGASSGPGKVTYSPKMGTVTFDHQAHQKRTDCATCHHTKEYAKCKSCHGVDAKIPKAKNAFHTTCKGCHKKIEKGPTKCKECHIK